MITEPVEILIVDDEARNLDVLEVMLASSGCTLVRANSADEALLAMLRHEFAAMILDIRMPGMSGIELANLVKQRRRTQDVPILFLTAHLVDQDDVLRGYGVGAVDYLSKPINADILRSKVAVFVELYRKTRALATLNEALQREIAEREKAQAALQQVNQELEMRVAERTAALSLARDEAERQSRLKDEFLATLSHELRTPMNAILGWLSMLGKGAIVKDPDHAMIVIQRNAQLQAKLIEDLLDMNTLTSGTVRLDFAPVDVRAAVESAIQTLKPTADTKGVNLSVAIEPGLSQVPADGRRLQQILWNLIHNAVKFTGAGAASRCRSLRPMRMSAFSSRIRERGFRPSSCRTCSTASARLIHRPPARHGDSASACPSRSISSSSMGAPSKRPAPDRGEEQVFSSRFH
jgi:signal transduction histidine kinase